MVGDAVRPTCPHCEETFDRVPAVDAHGDAPSDAGEPLLGGSVTCDRCGAEVEVYFYR